MSAGDAFSLPVAPPELCFDKDEFSKVIASTPFPNTPKT